MFQSIAFTKHLGYDEKTKIHLYEYELTDSDFSCGVSGVGIVNGIGVESKAIIQEYGKRKLNVAKNLLSLFRWHEKNGGWSIAKQIEWVERDQPLFTPELKTELNKYLSLL